MLAKLLSLPQKIRRSIFEKQNINLIRASGLFDETWYLSNNPDVAQSEIDPLLHYLRYGGFEGRDPSPRFRSAFYLDKYEDVKSARINPLIHYLCYGKAEGRHAQPPYRCPVCSARINNFLPISPYFEENRSKYGYPFTFDDLETMNSTQYTCPSCNASDRDRLYALYISEVLQQNFFIDTFSLLDIAPSHPLKTFFAKIPNMKYQSADKYMEGVDLVIDVSDMDAVPSESYDMFICSHVLEHVDDDKKALSELFRILKPGGFGILMVPIILKIDQIDEDPTITDVETRWRRFGQNDHVRLYSRTGFIQRIQEAGFILKQYGADHFVKDAFTECGISLKSVLYVGQKDSH
ncbi:MAG: class I SAM-dependent methyltransferase [Anaerolineaceae bacterium]|nr:class I SAM-dependent methyltransferase [Anaerolineaceae bacterium]